MSHDREETMTAPGGPVTTVHPDELGDRRPCGWMSRALAAITADLRLVDCGSLDVLLYCEDDVAVSAPSEPRLTELV